MSRHLYAQEEALFLEPALLGGKAANLAWLTREGLPVPRWWVVSTDAFARVMAENALQETVTAELARLGNAVEFSEVEAASARIRRRVLDIRLPLEIRVELASALAGHEQTFFAVRSSVLGEDAEGASFAGQMDSFLFQRGIDAVCDSFLRVCASAFNARALQYRMSRGIALTDIRAAVIIQEMVEGDVSGVMFTANPVTGSRRHALISAAWGTGEGIVAGICNTDEYNVCLADGEIHTTVADKDVAVIFDRATGRGTHEMHVDDSKRQQRCLSDAQVRELAALGRRIADLRRFPQDIEWTLRGGEFHVLQTRPVTRLPAPATPVGRRLVFDNSNIQESYCGVTTPLTFSFANRAYATVYEQTMRVIGVSEKQIQAHRDMLDNMLALVRGRIYYNINNWYRGLLLLPSFKENKADLERMMGLTDPVDLVQDRALTLTEKIARLPQVLRALFHLLRGFRRMNVLVQEFRAMFDAAYRNVPRDRLHELTTGELIEQAQTLDRALLQRWTSPIINDFYVMMMNGRVHRALVAAGFEHPAVLQNNLLSGEEGIESTEPTKYLLRMTAQVRTQPALRALIESGDNATLLARVQVQDAAFHAQCLDYIERYGDRTMGELKLESITLRQDPSFLFAILKNYLTRDDLTPENLSANEARFRADAEREAFAAIRAKQGALALRRFRQHLAKLRDAIRNRENMRLARTRMFGLYRDIFLEIGAQFALDGLLADKRDIFWITLDELYAWYDGRAVQTDLRSLVTARRAEYAAYEQNDLPHHFHTWGMVYHHNAYAYPHAVADISDGDIQGIGCYPGIVEENVRLIFSPDDELSLNGQILCTVRTDPGWAPLFPTAGGILVERGSTLSHSAVVARELGIPAIVGIPGITQALQNGERVRMDGSSGRVTRLEKPASNPAANPAPTPAENPPTTSPTTQPTTQDVRIREIDIHQNQGADCLDAFVALPPQVYAGDPFWLGEEANALRAAFSPADNPWFGEPVNGRAWLGVVPGQARLAGFFRPGQRIDGEPAAFFGYWECQPDTLESNRALFDALKNWARAQGATRLYGPINFTTFHHYRLRLDAFTSGAFPGEPWNPPYYPAMLTALGMDVRYRYQSTFNDTASVVAAVQADYLRVKPKLEKVVTLTAMTPAFWMENLDELYGFVDQVFGGNFAYTAISRETFRAQCGAPFADRFCPHTSVLARAQDGRIAGFFLVYPDYSPLLQQGNPQRVPAAEIHFDTHAKLLPEPHRALAKTGGVHPDFRALGLFTAMGCELSLRAAGRYEQLAGTLVREDNPSLNFAARHGGTPHSHAPNNHAPHNYALFQCALDSRHKSPG